MRTPSRQTKNERTRPHSLLGKKLHVKKKVVLNFFGGVYICEATRICMYIYICIYTYVYVHVHWSKENKTQEFLVENFHPSEKKKCLCYVYVIIDP